MIGKQQYPSKDDQPVSKPKKVWYKKVWVWILIIVFIIIIIPKGGGSSDTSESTQAAPVPTTKAPAEAATVVTADKMINDLEANALKAQTTYDGKRVQVTGYVDNIDAQGKYFSIIGSPGDFVLSGVTIDITPAQKVIVANFDKDQRVVITGTVTDVGELMGYRIKADTIK